MKFIPRQKAAAMPPLAQGVRRAHPLHQLCAGRLSGRDFCSSRMKTYTEVAFEGETGS